MRYLWYIIRFPFVFVMFLFFWFAVATGIPQIILNAPYSEPFTDSSLKESLNDVFFPWRDHGETT